MEEGERTGITDASDDLQVSPVKTSGLVAELEGAGRAYKAEGSTEAAAEPSDPGAASEAGDASMGEVSWIPEEDLSTTTIDRGDDARIDAIVIDVVSTSGSPECGIVAGPTGGEEGPGADGVSDGDAVETWDKTDLNNAELDCLEGSSISRKESASAGTAYPLGGASSGEHLEKLAGDEQHPTGNEQDSVGSDREALVISAAAAAAAGSGPSQNQEDLVSGGHGDQVQSDKNDDEQSGEDDEEEIAIRFNREEESTVSDLASSTATPFEDIDDDEGSSQVWTGHGIAIDLGGVDVSEVGSSRESSVELLASGERGSAGSSEMAVQSIPSTELPFSQTCQLPPQTHSTSSAGSELGSSQRKKIGKIIFDSSMRISLDDIHRTTGNSDKSQSESGSEGTVQSVLIYPPVEIDTGRDLRIDKSLTLEWVQKNIAQGGNAVEFVRRDSSPVPTTTFDNSYKGVSGHVRDSVDEEIGVTTAVEVRSRSSDADQRSDHENRDLSLAPTSTALWRRGRRSPRCILAVFALFLVVFFSGSVAGFMWSKRSSKEPNAVAATELTASPSSLASQAPTTKPRPTAAEVFTSAPIINPTASPTATPTIQNNMVEPPSMAPSTPEPNEPSVDDACLSVKIEVKYDNATTIGWTLVDTGDSELFGEDTYVDSFYSSDPDVVSQPQATEDCLVSGSYRWFTYGDGGGSYSLSTPSGSIAGGEVNFRATASFVIP